MTEQYIESIIIRQDNVHIPEGSEPTFTDEQLDKEFEFEGIVELKQIVKSVKNVFHNRHDYVFKIKSINKIQKQGD